jgi:hypothetical protein
MFFPAGIPLALVVVAIVYNSRLEAERMKKKSGAK